MILYLTLAWLTLRILGGLLLWRYRRQIYTRWPALGRMEHVHAAVCTDCGASFAAKRCAAGLKLRPCGRFSLPFGTKRPSGGHFSN